MSENLKKTKYKVIRTLLNMFLSNETSNNNNKHNHNKEIYKKRFTLKIKNKASEFSNTA